MNKDAFYFPHFSNARNDRKIRRLRKELGIEGYGIYFMLLETLRDQDGFKYPTEDLDLLAEEFNTSEQKIITVVCNYNLFHTDSNNDFFSAKFQEYLQPYLDTKERNRISGIKGNLIKHKHITSEQAKDYTDAKILEINECVKSGKWVAVGGRVGGESGGDRNKVKESKVKESKDNTISLSDKYPRDGELHPEMKYYRDNDKYIRFTEKFYERLKEENKARPNENVTKTKVTEIKRLETVDGYEWDKICNVAKYYLDHIHDSYAPQAYGAKSFREKYLKIRDFCKRHATT